MSPHDRQDENRMCRQVSDFDMPDEAQLELRGTRVDSFDIAGFNEPLDEFEKRVADREEQLGATPDWRGGNKNLESVRAIETGSGLVGKMFIHSGTVDEGTQGNGLGGVERYRDEGMSTEAVVHGQGISKCWQESTLQTQNGRSST